MGTTSQIPLIW